MRVAQVAGRDRAEAIAAGSAVLLAMDVRPDHRAFLRTAASLLSEALTHLGAVGWAQMRNDNLDLALAWTAHELRGPLVGARAALGHVHIDDRGPKSEELLQQTRDRARAARGAGGPAVAVVGRLQLAPDAAGRPDPHGRRGGRVVPDGVRPRRSGGAGAGLAPDPGRRPAPERGDLERRPERALLRAERIDGQDRRGYRRRVRARTRARPRPGDTRRRPASHLRPVRTWQRHEPRRVVARAWGSSSPGGSSRRTEDASACDPFDRGRSSGSSCRFPSGGGSDPRPDRRRSSALRGGDPCHPHRHGDDGPRHLHHRRRGDWPARDEHRTRPGAGRSRVSRIGLVLDARVPTSWTSSPTRRSSP